MHHLLSQPVANRVNQRVKRSHSSGFGVDLRASDVVSRCAACAKRCVVPVRTECNGLFTNRTGPVPQNSPFLHFSHFVSNGNVNADWRGRNRSMLRVAGPTYNMLRVQQRETLTRTVVSNILGTVYHTPWRVQA